MRAGRKDVQHQQRNGRHRHPPAWDPDQPQHQQEHGCHQAHMQPVNCKHMKYSGLLKCRRRIRRNFGPFTNDNRGQGTGQRWRVFQSQPQS